MDHNSESNRLESKERLGEPTMKKKKQIYLCAKCYIQEKKSHVHNIQNIIEKYNEQSRWVATGHCTKCKQVDRVVMFNKGE